MADTDTQVVLLSEGWQYEVGGWSGQRVYCDASIKPGHTAVALPQEGDGWDSDDNRRLIALPPIKTLFSEANPSLGHKYTVQYFSGSASDYLASQVEGRVVTSLTTGVEAQTHTYPIDSSDTATPTVYTKVAGGSDWTASVTPVTIVSQAVIVQAQATERYRGSFTSLITSCVGLAGKVNSNELWGQPKGNVLCLGINASPLVEVVTNESSAEKKQVWNVTYSYAIKSIPDVAEDAWQMVWHNGKWHRMAFDAEGADKLDLYAYATLPDKIS